MKKNKVRVTIEALLDDGTVGQNLTLEEGGAVITTFDKDNNLRTKTHAVGDLSLEGFAISVGKALHVSGFDRKILKPFNVLVSNTIYEMQKIDAKKAEEAANAEAPEEGEVVLD